MNLQLKLQNVVCVCVCLCTTDKCVKAADVLAGSAEPINFISHRTAGKIVRLQHP